MRARTPNKTLFLLGGIGRIVNVWAAICFLLALLSSLTYWLLLTFGWVAWTLGYLLLGVGLLFASLGYLGGHRTYGSRISLVSCVVTIVAGVGSFMRAGYYVRDFFFGGPFDWSVYIMLYEAFAMMMILWGVTHLRTRRFTPSAGLSPIMEILSLLTAVVVQLWIIQYIIVFYPPTLFQFVGILRIFHFIWILCFVINEILATIFFFMAVSEASVQREIVDS